jgi:hypothetical protein
MCRCNDRTEGTEVTTSCQIDAFLYFLSILLSFFIQLNTVAQLVERWLAVRPPNLKKTNLLLIFLALTINNLLAYEYTYTVRSLFSVHISPTKTSNHRVGRVLSFFFSRRNWDSPTLSPAGECAPPPPGSGGRGTLAGERGVGRVPIPTRGHTLWHSLSIRTLCQ